MSKSDSGGDRESGAEFKEVNNLSVGGQLFIVKDHIQQTTDNERFLMPRLL